MTRYKYFGNLRYTKILTYKRIEFLDLEMDEKFNQDTFLKV
jgi:hypothetical protein